MENNYTETIKQNKLFKPIPYQNTIEKSEPEVIRENSVKTIKSARCTLKNARIRLKKNKQILLVKKIKSVVNLLISFSGEFQDQPISALLSERITRDYKYFSKIFTREEGITIEKFIMERKIEQSKELLIYTQLSLVEIARKLQYGSDDLFTKLFVRATGVTPGFYRLLRNKPNKMGMRE